MKVTRPPGRDPAGNAVSKTSQEAPISNGRIGRQAASCKTVCFMRRATREARKGN
jgi:hypothetical protein